MRIMGIDFGTVRIGISITDESCSIAFPLTTLRTSEKYIEKIIELIKKYNVQKIVIGYPLNMNGSISKFSGELENFILKLKEKTPLEVIKKDERLTTKEVERRMIESDLSRKKRKKKTDVLSACIILQSYIDEYKKQE